MTVLLPIFQYALLSSIAISVFITSSISLYMFVKSWLDRKPKLDLPILNLVGNNYAEASRQWQTNYVKYLEEGYQKFRHGAYQLWGPDGYVVVLSPDFLGELKNISDDKVNFYVGAANSVQGKIKFLDFSGHAPIRALKTMLTPQLKDFMPAIMEELEYGTRTCLPSELNVWTEIHMSPVYSRIVGFITGRLFFGTELCRREDWLQSIIAFPELTFRAARKLRRTPTAWRFPRLLLMSEVPRIFLILMKSRKVLSPIFLKRASVPTKAEGGPEPELDFLQFLLECSRKETNVPSLSRQAEQLMIFMLAGVHTTNIAGLHMLYDLATMPEIIGPLRDDIDKVWDKCGGMLTKDSFRDLGSLDSFMKESQRMNPPSFSTFDRIVTAEDGVVLSNGLHLPHGTVITVPSSQVSQDPEVWENPHEYDALRFEKLRQDSEKKFNYQYATSTEQSLHFGVGKHSCPGRWVSTLENKTILCYMIRHFDFRLIDPKQGRPKNLCFGPVISPNEEAKIQIRRIRPHMC